MRSDLEIYDRDTFDTGGSGSWGAGGAAIDEIWTAPTGARLKAATSSGTLRVATSLVFRFQRSDSYACRLVRVEEGPFSKKRLKSGRVKERSCVAIHLTVEAKW